MPSSVDPWPMPAPGQKDSRRWETGLAGVPSLPILVVRGRRPGPVVLVRGGVHGDEYEGPAAIHVLFQELDPERLKGLVVGLPVVNGGAWQPRARTTPADGVDLNRVFPGLEDVAAGLTRNLAHIIFTRFVLRCDVLVDLHSGGVRLEHLPLVGWYQGGDGAAETLARGFGADFHPWIVPDVPGVLSYEGHRLGKLTVAAEWGGGGRLDPTGRRAYCVGLRRLLAYVAGDQNAVEAPDTRTPIAGDYQATAVVGLFLPAVKLGARVAQGDELGTLCDDLGVVATTPQAARAGIVAALAHVPWLSAGDRLAYIG